MPPAMCCGILCAVLYMCVLLPFLYYHHFPISSHQESQYAGKTGVVRAIAGKMASVYLYDDGQEVDIPTRYLEPTPPNKYDKV